MVSEVIVTVTTLCDICKATDQHTEATHTDVIKFNKRNAKQLDTCEDHYAMVETLMTFVAEHGAVPEAERKAEGDRGRYQREDIPCPIPGCDVTVKGNSGLSAHMRGMKHTAKERAAYARRKKSA